MNGPYRASAWPHAFVGWAPVPLPPNAKKMPPAGYTGRDGRPPTPAEITDWNDSHGNGNIAIVLPVDVVGIDVDAYGDKPGAATLVELQTKYGQLPPTVVITSRTDGISGIRLYRLPKNVDENEFGTGWAGIDVLRHSHRYVVAPPSLHPETGLPYRAHWQETGEEVATIPGAHEIPFLPDAWVPALINAKPPGRPHLHAAPNAYPTPAAVDPHQPCPVMARALADILHQLTQGGSRHDVATAGALGLARLADYGHHGGNYALETLRLTYTTAISDRASARDATYEWDGIRDSAAALVATNPTPEHQRGCCGTNSNAARANAAADDWIATLPREPLTVIDQDSGQWAELDPFDRAVQRKANELRINDRAKELLSAEKAGQAPPLGGISLGDFLAQPDEKENYRVTGLWPSEGRILLPAPAKAGKTTLVVGNLIPALVDGGNFLGRFATQPVTGRVVLFNMEVGERTLRRWMARSGVQGTDKVTVVNLRGKVSALGLSTEAGRKRLTEFLRNQQAEVVILDPLAPVLAAHGLDEDKNSDVALFFSWWSAALGDAGVVDDLITHHTGHAGDRSRGASRLLDEPDAIWTLTRETAETDDEDPFGTVDQRYLKAYGRDVDLPESGLTFNPDTGQLVLIDGGKSFQRKDRKEAQAKVIAVDYIRSNPGALTGDISGGRGIRPQAMVHALERLAADGIIRREKTGRGTHHYLSGAS